MKSDEVEKMIADLSHRFSIRNHFEKNNQMCGLSQSEKYRFSRDWYVVEFDPKYYFEIDSWCEQQFGSHPKRPDAWSRWWHKYETSILFRDQADFVLFTLRWL